MSCNQYVSIHNPPIDLLVVHKPRGYHSNFTNQPAAKKYNLAQKDKFPNTDEIYKKSFFIGLPTKPINNKILKKIKISFESALK